LPWAVHETVLTVEWEDVGANARDIQRWSFYKRLSLHFQNLSLMSGNMLFYCQRGFHRSAAILAMWLIYTYPQEHPDNVMELIHELRKGVEFFDKPGWYPPCKEVVKGWSDWLRQPIHDEDAACRRA